MGLGALFAVLSASCLIATGTASAANPVPFASAAGTCDHEDKPWSTGMIDQARDSFLFRYAVAGGPTQLQLDDSIVGSILPTQGPDTVWGAPDGQVQGGAPFTGSVSCNGANAGAFSVQLYDIPDTPTSFSGAVTDDGSLLVPNEIAYRAPAEGYYVADVSVSQGALEFNRYGETPRFISSSEQLDLDFLEAGEHSLRFFGADGPQAQWSITIRALPVVLSGLSWSKPAIEQGQASQLRYEASGETDLTAVIRNAGGQAVRTLAQNLRIHAGGRSLTWDGREGSGADVPDGRYTAELTTHDPSGHVGSWSAPIVVNRPPETRLTRKPGKRVRATHKRARVTFAFTSNEPAATFECGFSRGWTPCSSPQGFRLSPGRYVFPVRAKDEFGAVDRSPAEWRFQVRRARRR